MEMDNRYNHAIDGLNHKGFFVIDKDHSGEDVEIRERDNELHVVMDKVATCPKAYLLAWFEGYIYGEGGLLTNQEPEGDDPIRRLRSLNMTLMKSKSSGFSIIQGESDTIQGQLLPANVIATINNIAELKAWLGGCECAWARYS